MRSYRALLARLAISSVQSVDARVRFRVKGKLAIVASEEIRSDMCAAHIPVLKVCSVDMIMLQKAYAKPVDDAKQWQINGSPLQA